MKYYEVIFTIEPCTQVAQELLPAMVAEAGFETFEETETGLTGYVQQTLFSHEVLDAAINSFLLDDTHIIYKVREVEDRDWNEQWEQEGFEPITLDMPLSRGEGTFAVHDGRHLPTPAPTVAVEIDAKNAFGTGNHETTKMILGILLNFFSMQHARILDCGCGTGILGISALKLGAEECVAYDIDEWSVENTRHNAVINRVDDRISILHGDAHVLDHMEDNSFQFIVANINRNILLNDMAQFSRLLHPNGYMIISGFYQEDMHLLNRRMEELGLVLLQTTVSNQWAAMMCYPKQPRT